jgi:uncharacterized membrane protein YeiH
MYSQTLFSYLEASAVLVCALSGMMKAAEKRMDIVGTFSLAILVAFGGGTIRDLLLNRRPFFWVEHEQYLFIVMIMCIAFVYRPSFFKVAGLLFRRSNTIDAAGLALFTLSGLIAALNSGIPFLPAALIGVITGVAGGVLRDVVVNEIPVIFRPGGLYAVAAFAGCGVLFACRELNIPTVIGTSISFIVIVGLRLLSVYFGIALPNPHWSDEKLNNK